MHLVGDVRGRPCLIVDDIIATGGTITEGAAALREAGAGPEINQRCRHARAVRRRDPAVRGRWIAQRPVLRSNVLWPEE
jgi:hypoxanthine-guanine phosphoribosyltransferase